MLPIIVGLICLMWLICAVVVYIIGYSGQKRWQGHTSDVDKDVHDGSSLLTGGLIALILGPVGLIFLFIDWLKS